MRSIREITVNAPAPRAKKAPPQKRLHKKLLKVGVMVRFSLTGSSGSQTDCTCLLKNVTEQELNLIFDGSSLGEGIKSKFRFFGGLGEIWRTALGGRGKPRPLKPPPRGGQTACPPHPYPSAIFRLILGSA
jgi:hypothetical protein